MKKLVLIDGHALLFRAFYAYPELTTSKGELINAVYGFTNILLGVIRELKPTHLAVSFDLGEPTFRHVSFKEYKAQRKETPQELIDQEERVRQVVEILNIPVYEKAGFEADDVIGTLAKQAVSLKVKSQKPKAKSKDRIEVVIVTGDLDALQLVDDDALGGAVHVYVPGRGRKPAQIYDEKGVEERYGGLEPEQVPDLKGLAGDQSDNIPGVKGIGPKTAIELLRKYKTVEGVYQVLSSGKLETSEVVRKKLREGEQAAQLSLELARIRLDAPIKLNLKSCRLSDYDKQNAIQLFEELEFKSLIKKLPNDDFEEQVQEALF